MHEVGYDKVTLVCNCKQPDNQGLFFISLFIILDTSYLCYAAVV